MQARNPNNIRIIDVSHHQKNIDWTKVSAENIKGAFVKATEGIGYTDPLFRRNADGAAKAGLKVGFYHFAHPDNSPIEEAKWFADAVKGLKADLPYVLDLEQSKDKTSAQLTEFAAAWLTEVERLTGHRVMIYTGASFARSHFGKALAKWPLWVAHYGVNKPMDNQTWDNWAVFQYTSSGIVSGISGKVDMNEMDSAFWMELTSEEPKPIEKRADTKTQDALKALQTAGMNLTTEYWIKNAHEGGTVRGDYAALLIQEMADLVITQPRPEQPKPNPQPKPEPPTPTPVPISDADLERLAASASVYFEVGYKNGSGALLPNGYVLTAGHVVAERPMRVQTKDREWHDVTLVAKHPKADIALCRIDGDASKLPFLPISVRGPKEGDKLVSVGHGKNKKWSTEKGIVYRPKAVDPWIFDCTVVGDPDDSGSAMINEYGEVVGVLFRYASVVVKNGSSLERADGTDAVNVTHPAIREWINKYV